jgi:hypothetical protein
MLCWYEGQLIDLTGVRIADTEAERSILV